MKRILLMLLVAVLAISLVVIGCPPAEKKEEKILIVATVPDAEVLGYPPTMTKLYQLKFALTCVETLLNVDESGELKPGLATAWVADPAAKTLTLDLRNGVKFHDGSDFNSTVAKWNLDNFRIGHNRTELALVTSIDVIDADTIRLNLSKWDRSVLPQLALIPGLMISKNAFDANGAAWCEKNPVGTGPFKFVSWTRDVKQVYTRFDNYWQAGKPYLDGVEWHIIADPITRLAALIGGDVHVATDLDLKDCKVLETSGIFRVESTITAFYGLGPDSANPASPLADIRVRQAVEHAINKTAICKTIGYDYWQPMNQAAIPGSWADNPAVVGYPYSPATAKTLLEQAGYNATNKASITIYSPNSPQYIVDMVTAVHSYLNAVWFNCTLDLMGHAAFGAKCFVGNWTDGLAMMPLGLFPDDVGLLNRFFLPGSPFFPSIARPVAYQNKLIEVGEAPDLATMKARMWEAQKIMIDDNAMVCWIHTLAAPISINRQVSDDGFGRFIAGIWTPSKCQME